MPALLLGWVVHASDLEPFLQNRSVESLGLENVGQDGIWDGPVGQPGYVWLYRDGGRGKLGPLSLDTGQ